MAGPSSAATGGTVEFQNNKLISFYNELAKLLLWLRPGKLSLKVSRMKAAAEAAVKSYDAERTKLIDELVVWIPAKDGKPKKRSKRPHDDYPGVDVWDMGSNEAEWERRNSELEEGTSAITFPAFLTDEDLERFEKDRIEKPVDANGKSISGVDFMLLMPVFQSEQRAAVATKAPKKKADEDGDEDESVRSADE